MQMPLFSVLVANYNNGRYLIEAINSVYAQSYTNWEIIIVDDGSTDNSKEIYETLSNDSRVHIFYNIENKGCAYTKHQCVLNSNGYYCGYLDPDDVLMPNALVSSIDALSKNDRCVLSFSRHYICDEGLNIISESRPLCMRLGESYFEHHDYRAEHFAAFRRDAYIRMGGVDITAKAGVDADLYFRLEEQGDIAILKDITYKYRRCSTAITANWEKMMYWNLFIRHSTCVRRGLPVQNYSFTDFKDFIEQYAAVKSNQATKVLSSKAYKLGKFILAPVYWLRRKA